MSLGTVTEAMKYFWGVVLSPVPIALSLPPEAAEPERQWQGSYKRYAPVLCMGQRSSCFPSPCPAIQPVGILHISTCCDEISFENDRLLESVRPHTIPEL